MIFDFDGVILDTETPEYEAWREIFEDHGHALALETWGQAVGTRDGFDAYDHLQSLVGRTVDREALRIRRRERTSALLATHQLLPGVLNRLAEAEALGLTLAIASSADEPWIRNHLEHYEIAGFFRLVVSAPSSGLAAKPAPDVYVEALRRLGLDASEAMAIEDSRNGIAAARAAGLECIAVPNAVTRGMDLSAASLHLDSLADMTLMEMARHVDL